MWMIYCAAGYALACSGLAAARGADELSLSLQLGPLSSVTSEDRTLTFNAASRWSRRLFDVQSGSEVQVRGLPLTEIIKQIGRIKGADTLVFEFVNGMRVPVRLSDQDQIRQLFIAFETTAPSGELSVEGCPRMIYRRETTGYTVWRFVNQLKVIHVVSWKIYEAQLAQPSRHAPTHSGWRLYEKHCQYCHGFGGQGAKRGPDFLSDLDAYRRVPPLAVTAEGAAPSLHEKVSGQIPGGEMPPLTHVPKTEIRELWQWLHQIHAGATK